MPLEPEIGEIFRQGEIWTSPKGTFYRVIQPMPKAQVLLQQGLRVGHGRKVLRDYDHVFGWTRWTDAAIADYRQKWGIES